MKASYGKDGPSSSKLILFVLLMKLAISQGFAELENDIKANALGTSPVSVVRGVLGGRVLLPCDVTPPSAADSPILVLFYAENKKTPIYSLDSRGSSLYSAYHWSDPELEGRVNLQVDFGNQGLLLQKVRPEDEGLFRCRVDFKASPTRNTRVQLEVIEPPRHLLITAKWKDERVVSKVAGPFPERAEIMLSCQVMGGKPSPQVTWWHEGALLDDVTEIRNNQMTRNSISLPPLTRGDLLKNLTCQALNSNLTSPLASTVSVDLAFPPTSVRIENPNQTKPPSNVNQRIITVSEGERNPLRCEVEGSRPQALITWDIDGKNVNDKYQTITNPHTLPGIFDTRQISSTIVFIPQANDKDSLITCRALNPQLPDEMLYDTAKLDVLYKPRLILVEGKKIDLKDIKEGNDIYFECQVDANPEADNIIWARNGVPLRHNASEGVLLSSSGTSLILQDVTRKASGTYSCTAINTKGSSTSNNLTLNVKYVPVCSVKNGSTIGGGLNEMVKVSCFVDSHPPATHFRWAFNSTRGLQDISDSPYIKSNETNNVQYKIKSTDNFGAFLCWASNPLGDMKDPCTINVIPAAKPESVSGCEMFHNASTPGGRVLIKCVTGWNGGLEQSFTLEVRKAAHINTKVLSAMEHSSEPSFIVRDLQAGEEYLFTVTASNSRGTSDPVTLFYTVPGEVIAGLTHARTDPQKSFQQMMPLIAVFLGVAVTLAVSVVVVVCIIKAKSKRRNSSQKINFFSSEASQGNDPSMQTAVGPYIKEKEMSNNCSAVTHLDENSKFHRDAPTGNKEMLQYQPERRTQPSNRYYQRENEGLLTASEDYFDDDHSIRRRDDLPRPDGQYLTLGLPMEDSSNSLGRASTLSSGSSTSRPTFRSSQSTVVFNPKCACEELKSLEEPKGQTWNEDRGEVIL